MNANPLAHALSIADGEELGPEGAIWLAAGFRAWLRGDCDSLEGALHLGGANRTRARNAALLRAADLLDADQDLTAWNLAERLEQAIHRFESRTLARLRADPETRLSEIDAELLAALRSGARPMRSRRRLYELLRD